MGRRPNLAGDQIRKVRVSPSCCHGSGALVLGVYKAFLRARRCSKLALNAEYANERMGILWQANAGCMHSKAVYMFQQAHGQFF